MIIHTSRLHVQPQNHDGTDDIDGAIKATKQVYDRQSIHISESCLERSLYFPFTYPLSIESYLPLDASMSTEHSIYGYPQIRTIYKSNKEIPFRMFFYLFVDNVILFCTKPK